MIALLTVLAVVLVSLIVTRVATILLILTGMSRESARFQARSAISGVGFTTSEAESVTNHPQRRRIVLWLMLVGSAGLVTTIASVIVSFSGASHGQGLRRALMLLGGLAIVFLISRSRWVDRRLEGLVGDAMNAGGLAVRDYASLLDLEGDYAVAEKHLDADDWMASRTLRELGLREEGVVVLGVHRVGGEYLGAPRPEVRLEPGDRVVLYAREDRLDELDERPRGEGGERAHAAAEAQQRELEAEQAEPGEDVVPGDLERQAAGDQSP